MTYIKNYSLHELKILYDEIGKEITAREASQQCKDWENIVSCIQDYIHNYGNIFTEIEFEDFTINVNKDDVGKVHLLEWK